jgi:hypothetical protein
MGVLFKGLKVKEIIVAMKMWLEDCGPKTEAGKTEPGFGLPSSSKNILPEPTAFLQQKRIFETSSPKYHI